MSELHAEGLIIATIGSLSKLRLSSAAPLKYHREDVDGLSADEVIQSHLEL